MSGIVDRAAYYYYYDTEIIEVIHRVQIIYARIIFIYVE